MRKRGRCLSLLFVLSMCLLVGCGEEKRLESQKKYRQYGLQCMQEGKYEEAVEGFQNALDQSMGHVGEMELDICFYKAQAQVKAGLEEDALETYQAIISYNQCPEAYYLRGCLYFMQGYGDKGQADFDTAVKKAPKDYELYLNIYQTMAAYNRAEDGKAYLDQALALKGEKASDLLNKGRIYYYLGELDNAKGTLETALAKGSVDANYYLALIEDAAEHTEKAEQYFSAYIGSGNAKPESIYKMGERYMQAGDYTHAITYLSAGLAIDDGAWRQDFMRSLIICCEYTGDFSAAKEQMEEYLKFYPDDEDAKREQIFLNTR